MGLEIFCFEKRPEVNSITVYFPKTFHRVFTAVGRVCNTSRLLYVNKIFCTMLFSIDVHWNAPLWNWWNCLLDVLKCSLKIVLRELTWVNLSFERLFVTFWTLIHSHPITPCWLDDAKEFIQSGWSKQCDSCSLAHEIAAADAGHFESRISRKLFGS